MRPPAPLGMPGVGARGAGLQGTADGGVRVVCLLMSWLEEGMATHSRILAGKFHGQRSLVGYSSCGHKELGTTE